MKIGDLIKEEIRRQRMPITEFADKICCKRNNVYDIFKRSTIDTLLLKKIAIALKHNFFLDLAKDMELVHEDKEAGSGKGEMKRAIVTSFLELAPSVLQNLNHPADIIFPSIEREFEDCPVPDFGILDTPISFTIGETYRERVGKNRFLKFESRKNADGYEYELILNTVSNWPMVNVPVKLYTKEEYEKLFTFVFNDLETLGKE